jgi:hypothetical protein
MPEKSKIYQEPNTKKGKRMSVKMLKIADLIIKMQSKLPLEQLAKQEEAMHASERYDNFTYTGKQTPDILIDVDITDKLPRVNSAKCLFVTYHFQDGKENWRLLKKDNAYIYKSPLESREQIALVSNDFSKAKMYLLPKKNKGFVWNSNDIIYDFLQVLLINFFALKSKGIFTHSVGIKDINGQGLLFCGKSEAGKSTTARIWHKYSKAIVLNDDRIIIRKNKGKYVMYGSPWHGDFSDYLASCIEPAPLKSLFFISHAKKNSAKRISQKKAFSLLYPAMFPTFWDKRCLENIASFCHDMIQNVPCFSMGFVNNKKIIEFVRDIAKTT